MAPLDRAMVVSYRLSIHCDRCAICNHSAAICDRMSPTLKSTGGVTLCPNLGVFPLEQTRHVGVAKSEHPRLTNGEIIFEELQPMTCDHNPPTSQTDRQTDGRTDGRTDRRHAIAIPRFALWLKEWWCVKIQRISSFKRQYLKNGSRYGQSNY